MGKSVTRAAQILELISLSSDGLTHTEVAETLSIPKSSLSALLGNLVALEYLSLDPISKRYTLGPHILVLAGRYLDNLDLARIAQPFIEQLSIKTGESASFNIMSGPDILVVAKKNFPHPLRRSLQIGERAPIYATASGKAILAYRSDEEIEEYLSSVDLYPITKKTINDPEALRRQLKEIRAGGLGYCREEVHEDTTAIAAPIFDRNGESVAAINVIVPIIRLDAAKERLAEQALREESAALSRQLGFEGKPKNSSAKQSQTFDSAA